MGSEAEYSVSSTMVHADIAATNLAKGSSLPAGIDRLGTRKEYLSNGARFYLDHGSHPEYCSPETYGALESTISEFAGIEVVRAAANNLRAQIDESLGEDQESDLRVFRRVSDGSMQSAGHHINLRVKRELCMTQDGLAPQLAHMIGGTILFGAGCVRRQGVFTLSQKGPHISDLTDLGTTSSSKPLINLRDEPLDNKTRWRRLHITGNDSLFSPWATWLRNATFDIVLSYCESQPDQAKELSQYIPINLRAALRAINSDPERRVTLKSYKTIKAKDMEWALFEKVIEAFKRGDLQEDKLGEESVVAFDEWQWALESDDARIRKLVDWRLRSVVHKKMDAKFGGEVTDERRLRDISLDDVLKRTPMANLFQNTLFNAGLERLAIVFDTTEEDLRARIDDRVTVAPIGRASVRGAFIKEHKGKNFNINWEGARDNEDGPHETFQFTDDGLAPGKPAPFRKSLI